jgi:hypothetical protein
LRLCETPCFFPGALVERMGEDGKALIRQLVENPEYLARSEASIPAKFRVPNESAHPMFVQVDFGLVRDAAGELQPETGRVTGLPFPLRISAGVVAGLHRCVLPRSQSSLLPERARLGFLQTAVAGCDCGGARSGECRVDGGASGGAENASGFYADGEAARDSHGVHHQDSQTEGRRLFYEDGGKQIPIERIYNRTIVDELERKGVVLPFDFRDDLDVEWAGHPNWYFRISKYSIPYLKHPSVPRTWFLDQLPEVPADLENFVLKPLYSFAGLGVVIAPSRADIDAIPAAKRSEYILQERMNFTPWWRLRYGLTKVELRTMYVWLDELVPVLTIVRMGRGLMMGVDQNKNMKWVGSSAALVSGPTA